MAPSRTLPAIATLGGVRDSLFMEIKKLESVFKTDAAREENGVEVDFGEGFFVLVARANNKRSKRMFEELVSQPHIEVRRRAGLSADESEFEAFLLKLKATAIVVGWRGLTDGGKEVPYSPEVAAQLLQMKDFAAKID